MAIKSMRGPSPFRRKAITLAGDCSCYDSLSPGRAHFQVDATPIAAPEAQKGRRQFRCVVCSNTIDLT